MTLAGGLDPVLAVLSGVPNVDIVVMRSDSKSFSLGVVPDAFDPLLGSGELLNDFVQVNPDFSVSSFLDAFNLSDRDGSIVVTDSQVIELMVVAQCSGLLVRMCPCLS